MGWKKDRDFEREVRIINSCDSCMEEKHGGGRRQEGGRGCSEEDDKDAGKNRGQN